MANSADPDQLADLDLWIYTVCKGRVYPGSAGQGLNCFSEVIVKYVVEDICC